MKDRPVPRDEMPLLPIRHRDHADSPRFEELLRSGQFDELLGNGVAPMSDAGWQRVSDVFGSAAADPTASELTVDSAALAAFRRAHLGVPARRHLVRSNMINTLLSSKIAGAIACAAIGVTGAAGAAYANVLPRPIQAIAHNTIGAPTHSDPDRHGLAHNENGVAVSSPSPTTSVSASPSASVSATAARLCDEWSDLAERSSDDDATNVHDQLAVLAGGAANIATFCATVGDRDNDEHHSATPSPTGPSPTATTTAGDDQRHDQGDDRGRDGASTSPTQGSNRGPNPSPSPGRTDNSGPGNSNGNIDNSGPGNANDRTSSTTSPTNSSGSNTNDGRGDNDGHGHNENDG